MIKKLLTKNQTIMNSTKKIIGLFLLSLFFSTSKMNAQDQMLGEIRVFAGNFTPRGWAECNGGLIAVSQNTALFSLIGCTYGGDCRTTFAVPDLRGRVPVGYGNGPGLQPVTWGQRGGVDFPILTLSQLPRHSHTATVSGGLAPSILLSTENAIHETPETGDVPAVVNYRDGLIDKKVKAFGPPDNSKIVNGQIINTGQSININPNGNSSPFDNRQPFLGVRYIIAITGYFPPRN